MFVKFHQWAISHSVKTVPNRVPFVNYITLLLAFLPYMHKIGNIYYFEEFMMLHKNIIRHIQEATPKKEEGMVLNLIRESLSAIAFLFFCMTLIFVWVAF